ncbi:hypothetical protein P4V86_19275 [Brevibacillus laterosporus]|uniref:hypothetical protein n=1 Tax=Brevibacillus laterosporus TaxID=1465 RepID=UPI00037CD52E|nr:hypothetical protein [Brevibacillus laterosporus]ATO50115.1 hypothetical protein BrL25_14130 [Brevibacillus laterosporus DSM 25]MED2005464.1 hypothetical protein [Brevibacillus laterosporus]
MMTKEELQEIRERVGKATSGSWKERARNGDFMLIDRGFIIAGTQNDLDFIINARQDIPNLLSEIDRLRKALLKIELCAATSNETWGRLQKNCWIIASEALKEF